MHKGMSAPSGLKAVETDNGSSVKKPEAKKTRKTVAYDNTHNALSNMITTHASNHHGH